MDEDFLFSITLPTLDNTWLELISLQGISQSLCNSPPPLCSLLRVWVPTWSLVFPSYLILCVSFFIALIEKSLPISSLFSVRIGPHIDVFLCVHGGKWHQHPPTLPFWSPLWEILLLLILFLLLVMCLFKLERLYVSRNLSISYRLFIYCYTIVHSNRLWPFVLLWYWL